MTEVRLRFKTGDIKKSMIEIGKIVVFVGVVIEIGETGKDKYVLAYYENCKFWTKFHII